MKVNDEHFSKKNIFTSDVGCCSLFCSMTFSDSIFIILFDIRIFDGFIYGWILHNSCATDYIISISAT